MLDVEVIGSDGAVICRPKGTLDARTATTFRGAITMCLGEPGLIIDLSGLSFIDGAGLTALVGGVRRAQEGRTRVTVVVPPGTIRKVLDEAGLDMIVKVSEAIDVALAEIGDGAGEAQHVRSPGRSKKLLPCARSVGK